MSNNVWVYILNNNNRVEECCGYIYYDYMLNRNGGKCIRRTYVHVVGSDERLLTCSDNEGEIYDDVVWFNEPNLKKAIYIFVEYYKKEQERYKRVLRALMREDCDK